MKTDCELLQEYAARGPGAEEAFRGLIQRYVRLVFSACQRQLRDRHLAEDATQAVFVLLSQKAGGLSQRREGTERLAGWLLTVSRYACANLRRAESRRVKHEQAVAMENLRELSETKDSEMSAMLDDGLARLPALDREAVVRRYFQEQPLAEVGAQLGLSEEAARKRVERGVEKLRAYFARRGVQVGAGAMAAMLAQQAASAGFTPAMQAAMTQGILEICRGGASNAAPAALLAKGTQMMMLTTKLKLAAAVVVLVTAAGAGGWLVTTSLAGAPEAAAAATQPAFDLSTPLSTIASMCQALRVGDRDKAYAAMAVDPKRAPTEFDGFIAWNLSQNRLIAAATDAFGAEGQRLKSMGTFEEVAALFSGGAHNVTNPTADTAELRVSVPVETLAQIPEKYRDTVVAWSNRPLRFKKDAEGWKFDPDGSAKLFIALKGEQGTADELQKLHVQLMMDIAAANNQIAEQIKKGEIASIAEAGAAQKAGMRMAMRKAQTQGFAYMNLLPVDAVDPMKAVKEP